MLAESLARKKGSPMADRWGAEETLELLALVKQGTNRWSSIAKKIKRSKAAVRNKVLRMAKGAEHNSEQNSVRLCKRCGQPQRGHVCGVPASKELVADVIFEGGAVVPIDAAVWEDHANVHSAGAAFVDFAPFLEEERVSDLGYFSDFASGLLRDGKPQASAQRAGEDACLPPVPAEDDA